MRIPAGMLPGELALYKRQTESVKSEIKHWKEALNEEFGDFQTQVMVTGRVLLIPEGEPNENGWLCCYMSDETPFARLVIDDYVPELASDDVDLTPLHTEAASDR